MVVRVGLGFMSKMHFETYPKVPGAPVVALCDIDPPKRAGDRSAIGADIGAGGGRVDLSRYRVYADLDDLVADPGVNAVDITLPTLLDAPAAMKVREAGKHVIGEKPLARTSPEAVPMVAAARAARRKLFVTQCLRPWPPYAVTRRFIRAGTLGRGRSAVFRRLGATPVGSGKNRLQNPAPSGLCAPDMHIHDSDFILQVFGPPKSVTDRGAGFSRGRLDHLLTTDDYGDGSLITAEGGWRYSPPLGFEMTFLIALERATPAPGRDGILKLLPRRGQARALRVPPGDGYLLELRDFIRGLERGKESEVVMFESAARSVRLVEREMESAHKGRPLPVRQ